MKQIIITILITMMSGIGLIAYNKISNTEMVNSDIVLTNLVALANSEDSNGNGGGSDSGSEDGGKQYEYPNAYPYTTKCNVAIGKTWYGRISRCQVEVITCQGGGSGCNSKKCPVHPA
ncbi:MAG: hypothetical protein NC453_15900 [Muribaculum sp.]|nr:hypothetical protein [Muribaculum sp.]